MHNYKYIYIIFKITKNACFFPPKYSEGNLHLLLTQGIKYEVCLTSIILVIDVSFYMICPDMGYTNINIIIHVSLHNE